MKLYWWIFISTKVPLCEQGKVFVEQLYPQYAVLCNSKTFTLIYAISLNTPNGPIQVYNTHKPADLGLQLSIVPRIQAAYSCNFLIAQLLNQFEPRIRIYWVVDGGLNQEVGNVVGQIVETNVIIVNKMHFLTLKQNIQIVEVVVAQPNRLFGWRNELERKRLTIS